MFCDRLIVKKRPKTIKNCFFAKLSVMRRHNTRVTRKFGCLEGKCKIKGMAQVVCMVLDVILMQNGFTVGKNLCGTENGLKVTKEMTTAIYF